MAQFDSLAPWRRPARARIALVALAVAACGDAPPARAGLEGNRALRDSVRARRDARLAARPDTLGFRVDSLRIDGRPDARTFVVLVSDFQCAACRDVARTLLPAIRREFVDSGHARLAFVNFPQEANFNARFAAHAALCAAAAAGPDGQRRFWAMHDTLFATQAAWARSEDPRPWFDSLAVAVGTDAAAQAACTARQRLLPLITSDIERSEGAGVTMVPTLLIGEERLTGGDLTLPRIRRAIRAARR